MNNENGSWRLLDTGPGQAGWNMAVDEALLVNAARTAASPTLRFFSWESPSLSIGSFQDAAGFDLDEIRRKNIPLVRRPTGGRAVLHDAELTYSVVSPIPDPFFPSDLMGSYKAIGACFLRGLKSLGVDAALVPVRKGQRAKRPAAPGRDPLCFSSPSWHEVLAGGKKLIGSAQRRLKDAFLQQGSLIIRMDADALVSLMRFTDEAAVSAARDTLVTKMTALSAHSTDITLDRLKAALVSGFESESGARLVPGELAPEERELAERLFKEKYSRDGWNLRRETLR